MHVGNLGWWLVVNCYSDRVAIPMQLTSVREDTTNSPPESYKGYTYNPQDALDWVAGKIGVDYVKPVVELLKELEPKPANPSASN